MSLFFVHFHKKQLKVLKILLLLTIDYILASIKIQLMGGKIINIEAIINSVPLIIFNIQFVPLDPHDPYTLVLHVNEPSVSVTK